MGERIHVSKTVYFLIALIILLQALVCIHYCVMKKGFFVDELWGAGLANSYFRPRLFVPDVFNTNRYLPGSFFHDYLTVSPNEGFSIASVWYNQSQDSHPPFYFLLYHVLSCLKPGTFSKWTGFIINLFFLVCSDLCIFWTTTKLTKRPGAGIASVALWGFSAEAVSYTLCSRMYMMAAFFFVLFVYRTLFFFDIGENNKKNGICLLLATTGGCLTHYYFYIAAFVMASVSCINLAIKNGFRKACSYGLWVLGGVFFSWAVYPQFFVSLKNGDGRGREAVRNLKDIQGLSDRIGRLVEQIETKLLYKPVLILVLFTFSLIVIIVILRIMWKKQLNADLNSRIYMLLATELTFVLYMLAVAKLQPFYTNRYYFPITPLLWIVASGNVIILYEALLTHIRRPDIIKKGVSTAIALLLIAASAGVIKGHIDQKVMFLFPQQEQNLKKIQQMNRPSALFISNGNSYTLTAHCLELTQCSEALCLDIRSEDDLPAYDIHDGTDSIVVFATESLNQQNLVNQILEQTAYRSYELIGRGSGDWWENASEDYIYCFSN